MEEEGAVKIAVGADHGGFFLKEEIKKFLETEGYSVIDVGTYSEESVDYPEFAYRVAKLVISGEADRGVVMCGTGIGVSISANKIRGIRAALVTNEYMAEMAARHNDANVLAMGGRIITPELGKRLVKIWLETPFDGGRHQRRINKIYAIEEGKLEERS